MHKYVMHKQLCEYKGAEGNCHIIILYYSKAMSLFMCSRSLCSCIMLINGISTEAVMWLLLCGCVCIPMHC